MSAASGSFCALDHRFSLEVEGEFGLDILGLFDGLRVPDAPPAARYMFVAGDDDAGDLFADGDLIGHGRIRVLLQCLIARLGQRALAPDTPAIHGTAVGDRRGSAMLVGPSGRGKSTLAARLLADGLGLVAEDITALDPASGSVRTYHRPLGLSEQSFQLLDRPISAAAGSGGKVMVSDRDLGFSYSAPLPVRAVALVDHTRDGFIEHTPARMFARLLELGVVVTTEGLAGLEAVVALLAGAHCAEIGSADVQTAADRISQLLDRPPADDLAWLVERRRASTDVFVGNEAVVLADGDVQHLNPSAAAVHLFHIDGLEAAQIATQLGLDVGQVEQALRSIR